LSLCPCPCPFPLPFLFLPCLNNCTYLRALKGIKENCSKVYCHMHIQIHR
jgi:hypothetical protein